MPSRRRLASHERMILSRDVPLSFGPAPIGMPVDEQMVAPALDRLAEDFLRQAGRIAVGGVEHVAAGLEREVDELRRFLDVGCAPLPQEVTAAAEGGRAEDERRELQARAAKRAIFHFVRSPRIGRLCDRRPPVRARPQPTSTTTRPRILPSRMARPVSMTLSRLIVVVMAASFCGSRSRARRCQASSRSGFGAITESIPRSDTPRRMNGATEVGRSMPPASPQAAIAPRYFVIERRFASVVEPTASMPAAQRSLASGFAAPESSLRSTISAAPRSLR